MIIVLYIDNFIDIFRAGCNSLPVVKPTSRGASQSMIRCNSEADSKVWMKEVIDGLSCVMNIARDADMWMIHGEPELIGYQL